ncbi:MAG: Biopolymer transport protein ExbD/TolR [Lentisphaerae bacterium ADurb.BinA184]|nr:MAG: Biopolymer transport protein ExbD/TolR [Lentisphaerae bacterium ADurb.BinA184]
MGKRKTFRAEALSVPMSPMIDVVFQLLIYFIVTYKEDVPEAHLAVNVPAPSPPTQVQEVPPPLLEIEVHPGEYRLRGRVLSLATIQSTLEQLAATDEELTVIIKANQRAKTRSLIRILDVCKGVGLKNLNVMTLQ